MNEFDYMNVANNISNYLDGYLSFVKNSVNNKDQELKDSSKQINTVEEVLSDLIKMDKEEQQDGGKCIDDIVDNLTGGNANKKTNKDNETTDIINNVSSTQYAIKELDPNLMEGGNNEDEQQQETKEDNIIDTTNTDPKIINNVDETNNETNNESDSDSDDNNILSSSSSSDYEDETFINIEDDKTNDEYMFDNFLNHYYDTEIKTTMSGGNENITKNDKIQIIPMFPYLLRY